MQPALGELSRGTHEPLVPAELAERVAPHPLGRVGKVRVRDAHQVLLDVGLLRVGLEPVLGDEEGLGLGEHAPHLSRARQVHRHLRPAPCREPVTQVHERGLAPRPLGHLRRQLRLARGLGLRLEVVEQPAPPHPATLSRAPVARASVHNRA